MYYSTNLTNAMVCTQYCGTASGKVSRVSWCHTNSHRRHCVESCSQKVNRTKTDRLQSKPVFNLKPFLGFSSRWSRNIVEELKNMGKTDRDQHQIDENHYCSVIFSKLMNGNRLITRSTTKPLYDWRKLTLWCNLSKLIHWMKYMSHNWV